ncbi:MAG: hypothetical protein KA123_00190 [Candidatus Eisenbacteria bacterium]|nr:hypothetical protein [Candidatus Eisenbacteria bacterium]
MSGRLLAAVVCCCMLLALAGCHDENQPRSRVVITRISAPGESADLSSSVFQSDIVAEGEDGLPGTPDDIVYEDEILVVLENEPSSSMLSIDPEGAFGQVLITGYRIEYSANGDAIDPIEGAMHLLIPSGTQRIASVVLVSAEAKSQPPLSTLVETGGEIFGSATITLSGYEETSEDPIEVSGTIQIHFANWL